MKPLSLTRRSSTRITDLRVWILTDSSASPAGALGVLPERGTFHLVVHPNSKPPARNSWLGNLENKGSDLPTLSDERVVHVNPFRREILAELAVGERSADLLFPPPCVFDGVGVDHLIGAPCALRSAWSSPARLTPRAAIR